MASGPPAS